MKMLSKMRNNLRNKLKDNRGQGATEYILLLVVVVGIVMVFKSRIKSTMDSKLEALDGNIKSVTAD